MKYIGWAEEKNASCELVVSPVAETKDKLAPQRLGPIACGQLFLGEKYALAGHDVIALPDGKRVKSFPRCGDARCQGAAVLGVAPTVVAVRVKDPIAIQLLSIPAMADAGAAPPPGPGASASAGAAPPTAASATPDASATKPGK